MTASGASSGPRFVAGCRNWCGCAATRRTLTICSRVSSSWPAVATAFANLLIADEMGWVSKERVLQMYDTYAADMARDGKSSHLWPLWSVLAVDSWFGWLTGAGAC